jgi:enamine deaminase RidA (YjgF/YER057c/UK114 family)
VPTEVSSEEAQASARSTVLSVLGSLKQALGDLDRVTAWLMVHGDDQRRTGLCQTTSVINGFSDLIVELYGEDVGRHARTAIGVAALPLNLCVVIAAEVEIQP